MFYGRFAIAGRDLQVMKDNELLNTCCVIEPKSWRDDGRCGPKHLVNGKAGKCDPTADANEKGPCCSPGGWCGNSKDHCDCDECVNYKRKGDLLC